jgi:hypothetical protein
LKNFPIKYHDKKGDLVTITTTKELNLGKESADPQISIRLYILEGMKLYSKAFVFEKARKNFEVVQGEFKIPDKEAVMTSIGSENEHVKYVECLERGRKMSGLIGLIQIRTNKDVVLAQCEEEERLQSEKEHIEIEWDMIYKKKRIWQKKSSIMQ